MATNITKPGMEIETLIQTLIPKLSQKASVNLSTDEAFVGNTERWSHFNEPRARAVVNAFCAGDVEETVKLCASNNIPFIARTGGHGWTSALANVPENAVIINLRGMNGVEIDVAKGEARIEGGALTGEVLRKADEMDVHLVTGTCNTVGAIPPMLGGGLGHTISLYGLAIDNILSLTLVTASGTSLHVTPSSHPDLWYALRGAGHNFGIVTSVTVKCYPQINGGMHWSSMAIFPEGKLEEVIGVVDGGLAGEGMSCTLMFAKLPPSFEPVVVAMCWFAGPEDVAREKFGPLLELGPVGEMGGMVRYEHINDMVDPSTVKGGRKPTFSVGVEKLEGKVLRGVWDEWVGFTGENEGARQSVVLVESYWWGKAREVEDGGSAFPHRLGMEFEVLISFSYEDEGLDGKVEGVGRKVRDMLDKEEEGGKGPVYVNFAYGDEDLESVYGGKERLRKLKEIKEQWDPNGCFNFYNPIC